eukprot:456612_1
MNLKMISNRFLSSIMITLMIAAAASTDPELPQKVLKESNVRQLRGGKKNKKCNGNGCANKFPNPIVCDIHVIGTSCTEDCKSGSETCCGVTYDSVICNCISGIYGCYNTILVSCCMACVHFYSCKSQSVHVL